MAVMLPSKTTIDCLYRISGSPMDRIGKSRNVAFSFASSTGNSNITGPFSPSNYELDSLNDFASLTNFN